MPWPHKNHLYRGFHIEYLQVSNTGTLFFNYSAVQYLMHLHMIWTFFPPTKEVTKIESLLTSLTSGIFTVSGLIKWRSPVTTTEKGGCGEKYASL